MTARIEKICISLKKGTIKKPIEKVELKIDHGIVNDGHAGNWHRQISLLSIEDINTFSDECLEKKGTRPDLPPGCFAENILTSGIDLSTLPIGSRIRFSDPNSGPVVEITQIGKECHDGCEIKRITGACVMPKKGLFAKVITNGFIKEGDHITRIEKE